MLRLTTICLGLAELAALAGCGSTCESVQDEIQEIGREIKKKPDTAWNHAEELKALRQELELNGLRGFLKGSRLHGSRTPSTWNQCGSPPGFRWSVMPSFLMTPWDARLSKSVFATMRLSLKCSNA